MNSSNPFFYNSLLLVMQMERTKQTGHLATSSCQSPGLLSEIGKKGFSALSFNQRETSLRGISLTATDGGLNGRESLHPQKQHPEFPVYIGMCVFLERGSRAFMKNSQAFITSFPRRRLFLGGTAGDIHV